MSVSKLCELWSDLIQVAFFYNILGDQLVYSKSALFMHSLKLKVGGYAQNKLVRNVYRCYDWSNLKEEGEKV